MGLPMAKNLRKAGHELVACDLDSERLTLLGAPSRPTPAGTVVGAELIMLSLPSPTAVESALFDDDGACSAAAPGAIIVDTSTTSPQFAREMASRLEALGLKWLDAPVSGGPRGAANGSLTIMAGGREEVLEECRTALEVIGELILHVGGPGKGQAAKLCNNAIIGCTMGGLAEACEMARREGLDQQALYHVLTHSTADSRVLRVRYPVPGADSAHPASSGYEPLFSLDLETKDLMSAVEFAQQHGVAVPVIEAALRQFTRAQTLGLGRLDYSAVYLAIRGQVECGRDENKSDERGLPDSL
jgi:3-hydroxyisobutyrate dehydrogenase